MRDLGGLRSGQTTIETAVLVGIAIASMVAMSAYIRRGYQGYLYANASVHGQQFDPKGKFYTSQKIVNFTQVQDIDVISGQAAVGMYSDQGYTGTPPTKALATKAKVTTTWDSKRETSYETR